MKFLNEAKYNQPRTPLRLKSNAAPRLFSLTVFYRGLKHEHVTDFSGLDRLLSSWIINELIVRPNKFSKTSGSLLILPRSTFAVFRWSPCEPVKELLQHIEKSLAKRSFFLNFSCTKLPRKQDQPMLDPLNLLNLTKILGTSGFIYLRDFQKF